MERWYGLTNDDLKAHHGARLLDVHGGSLYSLLSSVYHEKEWLPWRFLRSPRGFWMKIENQRRYVEWLGKKLGYSKPEHWSVFI